MCFGFFASCLLFSGFCFLPATRGFGEQLQSSPATQAKAPPAAQQPATVHKPVQKPAPPNESGVESDGIPPLDWAPELLDAILSSPNADARDALLDAAFAAGQPIVPLLEKALQDDRTAEFASQSLAFIGGPKAIEILAQLMQDRRDLNLRRFYFAALAEFEHPQATQLLLYEVGRGDLEQDRTVTEAAILALTVRSDPGVVAPLKEIASKTQDIVIKDDIENAVEVIEARNRHRASPEGKKDTGSIEQAVRSYFAPALEVPSTGGAGKPVVSISAAPTSVTATKASRPPVPRVKVDVNSIVYSPDRNRALAHVVFDNPSGTAYYDLVLRKEAGDWRLASVWLGSEVEKPMPEPPEPQPAPTQVQPAKILPPSSRQ